MTGSSPPHTAILATLHRSPTQPIADAEFNDFALAVFAFQFEHNTPYRGYCERRGRTPSNVTHWHEIPAVPTAAFKEVALVAGDAARADLVFHTSGTTRGAERRGTHYVLHAELYRASLLPTFQAYVLAGQQRMRMLSLIAPAHEVPDSSLSYMVSALMEQFGSTDSAYFAGLSGIDVTGLNAALENAHEPVCLLGTSLAYVHWLEHPDARAVRLPEGSRLMDTGGVKGEQRSFTQADLHARYQQQLGITPQYCVNEYGMTELCSQYYDAVLREGPRNQRIKKGPAWLRARVVHPETLEELPSGETGILQHFDLANLYSVSAVLAEDLAYESEDGFVLLGRAPGAAPRGCSIAMDILLSGSERR